MVPHLVGQNIDTFIGNARVNGEFPDDLTTCHHPWAPRRWPSGYAHWTRSPYIRKRLTNVSTTVKGKKSPASVP
jgi:hypothetical protein